MRRLTLRWHLYIEQGEVSYSSLYFCAPQEPKKNSDKTDIGEETFEVISVLSKVINSLEFCAFAPPKKKIVTNLVLNTYGHRTFGPQH